MSRACNMPQFCRWMFVEKKGPPGFQKTHMENCEYCDDTKIDISQQDDTSNNSGYLSFYSNFLTALKDNLSYSNKCLTCTLLLVLVLMVLLLILMIAILKPSGGPSTIAMIIFGILLTLFSGFCICYCQALCQILLNFVSW